MTAQSIGRDLRAAAPISLNVEVRLGLLASNQADHEGRILALEQFATEGDMPPVSTVQQAVPVLAAPPPPIESRPRFTVADKIMAGVVMAGTAANIMASVEMLRVLHHLGLMP